jgi:quercetin dioxygenase-like cupin family protein
MIDFAILDYTNAVAFEDDDIAVSGFSEGDFLVHTGTTFVVVARGALEVDGYRVGAGMYACAPAPATFSGRGCRALLATVKRYQGIFALGGPVEKTGRLRYIDGCTDTGLIQPLKRGDPCLNALFFPVHTRQTPHYHPSHRIGTVLDGEGLCHHGDKVTPMRPGDMWLIPAGCWHWFETGKHSLRVVAFHPDSECGPTDETHQMLDATLVAA